MSFFTKDMVCISYNLMRYNGVWLGDNPMNFLMPRLMLQVIVASSVVVAIQHALRPLHQTTSNARLIGAIIVGPAVMGRGKFMKVLFAYKTRYLLDTLQYFGFMFFLFMLGLKMDLSMVKKSGYKSIGIGFSCFFVPLFLSVPFTFILKRFVTMDPNMSDSLVSIALLESFSSFHVIAGLLTDLKLLNSELGRLALSSSMISGLGNYGLLTFANVMKPYFFGKPQDTVYSVLSVVGMFMIILLIMRPIVLWLIRTNTEGSSIKEFHMIIVMLMVLCCGFLGESVGQHYMIGPMLLGLVFPVGSSFGSEVEAKLHPLISLLLVPLFYASCGGEMRVESIQPKNFFIVQFIMLFAFLGKLIGVMLASLYYCQMPFNDALLVGLILSAQGIVDVQIIKRALDSKVISSEVYTIMLLLIMILTGTIAPFIKAFYNPSSRYMAYKKRTILHTKPNAEFRILTCVYTDDDVPSLINILEASNPSKHSPICVYLVHLIELQGRSTPILISHSFRRQTSSRSRSSTSRAQRSQHIVNAFRFFEKHNLGLIVVDPYTAISPWVTMHEDVCSLALEKKTSLIIIPFHKQASLDGVVAHANRIRIVNKNILRMAPCSVGILIEPNPIIMAATATATATTTSTSTKCSPGGYLWTSSSNNVEPLWSLYRVGVLFLGGSDDREALAYSIRMSEQCNVNIALFRFVALGDKSVKMNDKKLDGEILDEYRDICRANDRAEYNEVIVKDGVGTVSKIQALQNSFDLLMVGRHHDLGSPLISGLAEWNQFPELGVIGDILATTEWENKISMLVIQQQFRALNLGDQTPKKKQSTSI